MALQGRLVEHRAAVACAFTTEAVVDIANTRTLIERLKVDNTRLSPPCVQLEQCRPGCERGHVFAHPCRERIGAPAA